MAITSLDGYIGSVKQDLLYYKFATRTTVAAAPFSIFDLAGNPGAAAFLVQPIEAKSPRSDSLNPRGLYFYNMAVFSCPTLTDESK